MKFVNLIGKSQSAVYAEFFTEPEFKGNAKKLHRGEYGENAVGVSRVKSVKVSDFATVTFYETPDGPGKSAAFTSDAAEVKLGFTPSFVTVESHVKGWKNGVLSATLTTGEYEVSEIKKFDRVSVPRGTYLVFLGSVSDPNSVHLFENEDYTVDARIDGYKRVAIFPLDNDDVRLNFKLSSSLSDDDLLAVAGGVCLKNTCGAKACAADSPCGINA
ncbi:MAG: hypothetical protein LBQ58_04245 [Synergistaceae bacterium]|jgi:hypothetical protein|nr:hypothetical protein [Synergistaceae bacterium]